MLAAVAAGLLGFASMAIRSPAVPTWRATPPTMRPASALEQAADVATRTVPVCTGQTEQCTNESPTARSVLVLGWFFATERELEYVRRAYKRNGFTDIVIQPSQVGIIAKPRGWYRSMRRRLQPRRKQKHEDANCALPAEQLGRHFDVVHCLSGGFLALYVLLRSGVDLRFNRLLFDSTPILPKPSAFTRFARAYMESVGLALPLKLFPAALHLWLVSARWWLSITYIKLKHTLLETIGRMQGDELNRWTDGPVQWALDGDYDRVSRHALGTIYEGAARCKGSELIFMCVAPATTRAPAPATRSRLLPRPFSCGRPPSRPPTALPPRRGPLGEAALTWAPGS